MAYQKSIGIAAGAGLTSALLFAASAKGGALAIVIAYVTPLPLMIATIGFAQATGLLAAGIACCVVALLLGVLVAGVFGVLIAFPAWWLAFLTQLGRPAAAGAADAQPAPEARAAPAARDPSGAATAPSPRSAPGSRLSPPPMMWYPLGRVLAWAAALVAAVVLAFGAATMLHYGGFDAAVTALTERLKGLLADQTSVEQAFVDSAGSVIRVLPGLMAGSTFLMLALNLWVAGRVVQGSGLLARPWPALPENLRLPRPAAAVLVAAGVTALVGRGPVDVAAGVVAAPLAVAFTLQGLGSAHALTRGLVARRLILFTIYFISLSLAPALLALAVLGLVDCVFPLRRSRTTPSPTPT